MLLCDLVHVAVCDLVHVAFCDLVHIAVCDLVHVAMCDLVDRLNMTEKLFIGTLNHNQYKTNKRPSGDCILNYCFIGITQIQGNISNNKYPLSWVIKQLFHTFLCNSQNYHPLGAVDDPMHCCPRPSATATEDD